MTTDATIASRRVLTSAIGAGFLTTLIDVCTQAVQQAKAGAAGHTAIRARRVHTLLTRAQQGVLALVHVCAGVSSEFVSMVTDTAEAARGVLTAGLGTTGAEGTLICVMAGSVECIWMVSTWTHTAVTPHWLIHTQARPTDAWPRLTCTVDSRRPRRRGNCHCNEAFRCGGDGSFGAAHGTRASEPGQSLSSNCLFWGIAAVWHVLLSVVVCGIGREQWRPPMAQLLDGSLSNLQS